MDLRIAIFDDNAKRREGLQLLIDSTENMSFVGSWPDCRDVVRHIAESTPDVVLMDIDMPHVDGIAGVVLIRKQFKDVKILMQTVFKDNEKIFDAILAGANGYLLKQTAPTKLIDGIIEVAQGGAPMTPIVASKVLKLFAQRGNGSSKTVDFNLTDREVEILRYLVDGYSYKMIADKCGVTYATVNTHVSHIYQKLQVKSVAGAVSLAVREGLV